MNKRSLNIRLAWLYSVIATILIFFSGYFWYAASSVGKIQSKQILAEQCVKEFEVFGIKSNIRPQDHAIVSYQEGVSLIQDRVKSSSIVIGRCAGYQLVEFCAGNGCPKPGVFFIMQPS